MNESLYFIYAIDGADGVRLRREHLHAHLAYVETQLERYRVAGPSLDEVGVMNASVLIVAAKSEVDARALIDADPYFAAGLYRDVTITEFRAAAGTWVGGKTW
jgi:uncharacterized protein